MSRSTCKRPTTGLGMLRALAQTMANAVKTMSESEVRDLIEKIDGRPIPDADKQLLIKPLLAVLRTFELAQKARTV